MVDLLLALGLVVGGGGAAELVRTTCRRRLLTPVRPARSRIVSG